jgi:heptosyltransferase-2
MTRVLLVAPQGLGDCLEATPLLSALKRSSPGVSIDVIVTRGVSRLLFTGLREYVDDVIYLPYWDAGLVQFLFALLRERRGRSYDTAFLAYPSARFAYEMLLCAFHAKRRYAHRHRRKMLLDLPSLHTTLVPVREISNVERNRDLLRAAGIAPGDATGYLVPDDWIDQAAARVPNRVAINVGSASHDGLTARRWPLASFTELCRRLVSAGADVTVIVGPEEREESNSLLREVAKVERLEAPLPEVARFLSTCAVAIANDGGIAHLAAGVGAPVVALFGPTPVEHAPFSRDAIALRPSDCPPCFDVRRPIVRCVRKIDFRCLKRDLSVDLVTQTALRFLQARADAGS